MFVSLKHGALIQGRTALAASFAANVSVDSRTAIILLPDCSTLLVSKESSLKALKTTIHYFIESSGDDRRLQVKSLLSILAWPRIVSKEMREAYDKDGANPLLDLYSLIIQITHHVFQTRHPFVRIPAVLVGCF